MIVKEKIVKIIDFGMAKKVPLAYTPQTDCSTTVVGTLPYMVKDEPCAELGTDVLASLNVYRYL